MGKGVGVFLTSALVAGEWPASLSGRFTPWGRGPDTHWIGGWVDPRAGLDDVEKRKFLTLPGLGLRPLCRPARNRYHVNHINTLCGEKITEILTLAKEKDQGLESVTVEGQDGTKRKNLRKIVEKEGHEGEEKLSERKLLLFM
jgi:hypothetical protein